MLTAGLVRLEWSRRRRLRGPRLDVRDPPRPAGPATSRSSTARARSRSSPSGCGSTYDRGPFTPAGLSVQVRGNVSNYHSVWRYGEPTAGPRRHDADARRRRRPGRARVRHRVPLRRRRARRLALVRVHRRRLGQPARRRRHRPLRLLLRPRLRRRAARVLRRLRPHAGAPALGARQLVEPLSRYSADSYLELLDRFEAEGLPFSVAVLDMDWHRVDSVPDALRLRLDRLQLGARAVPRPRGVPGRAAPPRAAGDAQRAPRRRRARLRGRLPARWPRRSAAIRHGDEPIAFDITDRAFLDAYLEVVHHPLEAQGVDFWWLDWQQGQYSRIEGIDPLWMLNHFHYLDSGREGRRPLTFSRYAGPGSHRYPIGFSGDTHISWASLRLPAGVHGDGVERRLRLVEPRRRRPHLRRARRRAGHALGAARRLLADPAPALVEQPVPGQGAVAVPARGARRDGRRAALPPPARALPAHHEPPRGRRRRAAGAADVPPGAATSRAPTRCRTSSRSAPS